MDILATALVIIFGREIQQQGRQGYPVLIPISPGLYANHRFTASRPHGGPHRLSGALPQSVCMNMALGKSWSERNC
jgi:hypothetical protein